MAPRHRRSTNCGRHRSERGRRLATNLQRLVHGRGAQLRAHLFSFGKTPANDRCSQEPPGNLLSRLGRLPRISDADCSPRICLAARLPGCHEARGRPFATIQRCRREPFVEGGDRESTATLVRQAGARLQSSVRDLSRTVLRE